MNNPNPQFKWRILSGSKNVVGFWIQIAIPTYNISYVAMNKTKLTLLNGHHVDFDKIKRTSKCR